MLARLKRPVAAFIGLWFLIVMIEPEVVHSCPVHGRTSSAGAAHAVHHVPASTQDKSDNSSHGLCSCPGDCAQSSSVAISVVFPEVDAIVAIVSEPAIAVSESSFPERADLVLPFSIGPPGFLV